MFWHAEEGWKTVDTDDAGSFTQMIRERVARSREHHFDSQTGMSIVESYL